MPFHNLITNLHNKTDHIVINPHRCVGCFQCTQVCPKDVLCKIPLPFHKHVHINHPEACIGCQRCIQICPVGAISLRRGRAR